MIMVEELLIGAHTSTAGGVQNALLEGQLIGATTVQLFTSNQKQWKGRVVTEEMVELFKETKKETRIEEIMSHASYLINLGSNNPELLEKSRVAFKEEVERCQAFGLTYLNFHPGAATGDTKERCLDRIVESLCLMEDLFVDDSLRLLLETTAGQGSSVGGSFEDLAYILERTKHRLPIGVCIDTCHIFVTGYDIRTEQGWNETLEKFDRVIGLDQLYAFHVNDSVAPFDSHKDRHAQLGEGEIGMESFKVLMHHPKTQELPKYLETPGGVEFWDKEIGLLREFAR